MGLNEMEKRLLFQVEGDYQFKVLNELYMTAQYTKNPEQRKAAENLMAKLRVLTDAECMDIVRDTDPVDELIFKVVNTPVKRMEIEYI